MWTRTQAFPAPVRRRILARDPVCRHCAAATATIADHIVPVAEGGADDEANGQGLCTDCHQRKTRAEIARGVARWQQRRERQRRPAERHPGLA